MLYAKVSIEYSIKHWLNYELKEPCYMFHKCIICFIEIYATKKLVTL